MNAFAATVVRACLATDVPVIASTEPESSGYAQLTFAAQEAGRCAYLVAWHGERPVGSGELELGSIPELKNLHVLPALRGQGIGSSIIRAAESLASTRAAITIGVGLDNPNARRLYKRLGYEPTARVETYTYEYLDAAGAHRSATETAEYLQKSL